VDVESIVVPNVLLPSGNVDAPNNMGSNPATVSGSNLIVRVKPTGNISSINGGVTQVPLTTVPPLGPPSASWRCCRKFAWPAVVFELCNITVEVRLRLSAPSWEAGIRIVHHAKLQLGGDVTTGMRGRSDCPCSFWLT
jgi:hypothetical protein